MDATCAIQDSIHVSSLVRKYVSRILGTYQAPGFSIPFWQEDLAYFMNLSIASFNAMIASSSPSSTASTMQ